MQRHTLRTRFAPRRKPCAETARLSAQRQSVRIADGATLHDAPVLSCSESRRSPRSATLVMLSRMMPTVSSIWAWMAAVFALPWLGPAAGAPAPLRGR